MNAEMNWRTQHERSMRCKMPTYEFRCGDCDEVFDVRASLSEKEKGISPKCPGCGSENTGRVFAGVAYFAKSGKVEFTNSSRGGCCSTC